MALRSHGYVTGTAAACIVMAGSAHAAWGFSKGQCETDRFLSPPRSRETYGARCRARGTDCSPERRRATTQGPDSGRCCGPGPGDGTQARRPAVPRRRPLAWRCRRPFRRGRPLALHRHRVLPRSDPFPPGRVPDGSRHARVPRRLPRVDVPHPASEQGSRQRVVLGERSDVQGRVCRSWVGRGHALQGGRWGRVCLVRDRSTRSRVCLDQGSHGSAGPRRDRVPLFPRHHRPQLPVRHQQGRESLPPDGGPCDFWANALC